ncbi:carbamoyl phosphate synthase small subunit [Lederbergia lenta]|uniref:Carbamoyl phosphate synthase small chain n=1 Tax=Lederbergia lenta TaxID=1467 RepID=A0A2X4W747_LEDLE|nr:carbamoyl phosphate synthase small subunit [Lederbergia lenta]MCM3110214.1 carbamoyl phosphate synthase small subunit [Lederbergia lenta]MEC2324218.1 carbamoyl phosphate synthase small subunit [Lederbergia lenta]SQI60477.1 carbamoyl phosphate synthase small subunit [Lederbergia lenta]
MKRKLILEDGTVLIGTAFGGSKDNVGEVVFNTSMSGYQEAISDPSNYGQILTFSYPLIGNAGINRDDFESIQPVIKGVIVKEVADFPSNWRNNMTFANYLELKNIPGIAGIDTRMLTRIIREKGTMKGAICNFDEDDEVILSKLKAVSFPANEVKQVAATKPYPSPGRGMNVVVVDFGLKHGILRELTKRGCDVTVVPYHTAVEDICALSPDGVLLSNGPGNPMHVEEATEMIRELQKKVPLFGIGLGHQLFAIANGCKTEKMKFGHRGSSYPVKDLKSGKILFTSQNHGYEVEESSIDDTRLKVTYRTLNGGSIEGLEHQKHQAFSVQFQPEASPGSEDGKVAFDRFIQLINEGKVENHA